MILTFLERSEVDICSFEQDVLGTFRFIDIKFGADIHIPLRIYCTNFNNPQTFHWNPLSSQILLLFNIFVYDQILTKLVTFPLASDC